MGEPTPAAYTFDVDVVVCIDANGTMTAYWKDEVAETYSLVHTVVEWDGSATTSATFDSLLSNSYGSTDKCFGDATVTITATGTDLDGSTLVDVDWTLICTNNNPYEGNGSFPLKVAIGEGCPTVV